MHPDNSKHILFLQNSTAFGGATYSLLDLIRVLKEADYSPVVACPRLGWLTGQLVELQTPYLVLPFYAWRKWLERPWVCRSIRREWLPALACWNFHIVHSNEFWCAPHAIELARLLKIPTIVHLRDGHHTLKKALQYRLEKADVILAVATDLRNQFVQHQQLYDKTQVLFNGIDEKRLQGDRQKARETFAIGPQEFALGNIGNLSERKNQRLLLRTMASLKRQKRITQFKILFAGEEKSEYPELMKQDIRHLGLQEEVRLLGPVKDMGLFFAAMDLVVHCASREGFPRVIPEAMLAKRAVVSTAVQGTRDAIPDERFGIVVPVENEAALEDSIVRLLKNPLMREEIAQHAYQRAQMLFSLTVHRNNVLKLYENLSTQKTKDSCQNSF